MRGGSRAGAGTSPARDHRRRSPENGRPRLRGSRRRRRRRRSRRRRSSAVPARARVDTRRRSRATISTGTAGCSGPVRRRCRGRRTPPGRSRAANRRRRGSGGAGRRRWSRTGAAGRGASRARPRRSARRCAPGRRGRVRSGFPCAARAASSSAPRAGPRRGSPRGSPPARSWGKGPSASAGWRPMGRCRARATPRRRPPVGAIRVACAGGWGRRCSCSVARVRNRADRRSIREASAVRRSRDRLLSRAGYVRCGVPAPPAYAVSKSRSTSH